MRYARILTARYSRNCCSFPTGFSKRSPSCAINGALSQASVVVRRQGLSNAPPTQECIQTWVRFRRRVVHLSGQLFFPHERFAVGAEAVWVELGPFAEDEKEDMIHELNAEVTRLLCLNEPQLMRILENIDERSRHQEHLDGVLRRSRTWRSPH